MDEQNNINAGTEENSGSSIGPIIGIIVILAIIILGGLYFWNQRADVTDQTVESINTQNVSDEAAAIEADLNATDIENLDAELNAS
ncbi:MAG: hypothetical protein A3C70_02595 [Candidatus Zambryskibacteria bacterium RIFCSPHIGHO2_02_FULL_43_14]|uniref:Uncharacterized protein n=1 Tax=Candidatus Zambryskibacteria bacterium RIFCSPHIGHO2_02_FULL_43_14 TaxID=1802748 RepID=A0A1G2TIN2_9BACT|nr:MAG: hypothetical protein A2829_00285 [Candidatus Zambryskibacteria bacterium RIFCSPHIGHO2_01_FULL_43_60]OHA97043.1 MAG: hypothetical protein A3C70_02595 [Candidatus Zambryskibacteria bacterium RIFCSPHIGHO2_02_FULL_43_14]OHB03769.1 MAG: hypothetical protein A3B03_02150 [Candidatus Zambryskibacteria bacterium RIFCSPLOWO2_01_FULL_42_41]